MGKKYLKGFKGSGNGYHDSATYKSKKINAMMDRVHDAMSLDIEKALANNKVLEEDGYIDSFAITQICIFCPTDYSSGQGVQVELVEIKEQYFKCPICGFIKKKKGVEL